MSSSSPPATPAAIAVTDLVKRYGRRTVVDGVSLTVDAGQAVALLGPNGAGKTTTVECIEGFRQPDGGQIRIFGLHPTKDRAAVTSRVGVMLQEGGVWQAASPREVLRLYARLYPSAVNPDDLIERLDLGRVATAKVRTLSGGEKQRLNLALALVGRPELLILDEPSTGMDPEVRAATWAMLGELRRDTGTALLLTTHNMTEAETLADRVAVMARGRVLAEGTTAELVNTYAPAGVTVSTPDEIDPDVLAASVGAPVRTDGAGVVHVDVDPSETAAMMSRVTEWFARQGLTLSGVTTGGQGLESAYLEITRQAFGEPAALPDATPLEPTR
ncbi:ABC transporter ATP-binding protein [Euzebya tangerina]|uniref:ABC transporter ATP-binding protein n=1 Tax=Euzebya tangerina TaxID=591198 RepID=UPI000E30EBDE|nr:ABC transporter ATP-binding protein [Euzebya tangerina]